MARARNIKPSIFKNEVLGVLDPLITLLFESLWCLADREGRLEDRPLRIKAETFPYREGLDVNGYLTVLEQNEFIVRYEVGGQRYIQVVNFEKHQSPHKTEKASEIPAAPEKSESCALTVIAPLYSGEKTAALPPDSLIPSSLIADSLFPDSPIPDSVTPPSASLPVAAPELLDADPKAKAPASQPSSETALQAACRETWLAYATAYQQRYSVAPERNARINTAIKSFVQQVPAADAPYIAAFYVQHDNVFYVRNCHSAGALQTDAQKLLTEWRTGNRVTNTKAQEADRLQAQGDGWRQLKQEARAAKEAVNAK